MSANCVLQTRVDEETKRRAQKEFAKRGMTVSEGLRLALNHEIEGAQSPTGSTVNHTTPSAFSSQTTSASARLQSLFYDADKKIEASGTKEINIESIVEFCDSVKQQRANQAAEFQW